MESEVHVLHVDDEPGFAEMVAKFLRRADDRIAVTTARSADEGLDHLTEGEIDCVVSDYDMPGGDGLAFLERVRERDGDLPFVLFTGKGSEEIASEAISAGVTDYLQKVGGTDQYAVLAQRITHAVERRRTEEQLESERRRFTRLTEHSTDVIVIVDEDLRFSYVSASVQPILGHRPEDLVGEDALAYVHPDDRHVAVASLSEVIDRPEMPMSDEVRLRNADGTWTWIEARARSQIDDPDVGGIVIYSRDISDRKARENDLREIERRFRAVFERSFDAMLIADDDGRYIEVNDAACELFGLDREALLGRRIEEFAPEGFDFEAAWREFQATERERSTFPLVRPDGEVRTVEYAATTDVLPGEHLSILRESAADADPRTETGTEGEREGEQSAS
ncbi:PAS domain S-box protein [Salinirubellus sp. GCM10025818]|uniref:PAS domain-containing response regulator n=1 Tax=Salinirubellus TaxID=2162630 RepID=UPI0030D3D5E9